MDEKKSSKVVDSEISQPKNIKPDWMQRAHVLFLSLFDVVGDQKDIERLAQALEAARRSGQEEMRDRIAENLLAEWDRYPDTVVGQLRTSLIKIVRAIPIGGQDE